jgi:hypothetical protein
MKNTLARFVIISSKIQKRHIQLFVILLTLAMLVLGAGAPDGAGPN